MGTSGSAQAGDANFDHSHAVLWLGSASSFLDLEAVLSLDYSRESHAMAVWTDGSVIQVGGYASPTLADWNADGRMDLVVG